MASILLQQIQSFIGSKSSVSSLYVPGAVAGARNTMQGRHQVLAFVELTVRGGIKMQRDKYGLYQNEGAQVEVGLLHNE